MQYDKVFHNLRLLCSLVMMTLCLYGSLGYAKSYYVDHPSGWKWYREENKLPQRSNQIIPRGDPNPTVAMESIRTTLSRALDQAIIDPSEEHIAHYIRLQQPISRKASQFSEVWQQVLLEQPPLIT